MEKPSLLEGLCLSPWLIVLYQLVFACNPAWIVALISLAALVKVLNSDDASENDCEPGPTWEVSCLRTEILPDDFDKLDLVEDDSAEYYAWDYHGVEDILISKPASVEVSQPEEVESYFTIGIIPDEFDRLDLAVADPTDDYVWDYYEVGDVLLSGSVLDAVWEPLEDTLEDEDGLHSQARGDSATSSVAPACLVVPEKNCLNNSEELNCFGDWKRESDVAFHTFGDNLRQSEVFWAVGGIRLLNEVPNLRRDIDEPMPKFIETKLILAPEADSPIPVSEFFYNYRFFYRRHRENWIEMRSKEVFNPVLGVIDEDSEKPTKVKDKRAKRFQCRAEKLFGKWKKASDLLFCCIW